MKDGRANIHSTPLVNGTGATFTPPSPRLSIVVLLPEILTLPPSRPSHLAIIDLNLTTSHYHLLVRTFFHPPL